MKRVARIIAIGLSIVLGALVLAIIVAIVYVRSEDGRARLLRELLIAVEPMLAGELEIARIEGSFTSGLRVSGIQLFDPEGRRAVAIGTLEARYHLGDLIDFHVEQVALEDVAIDAFTSTNGLNLARLVVPSTEPAEPLRDPLSLAIDSIRVAGVRFALDGKTIIERADLSLELVIVRDRLEARRVELAVDGGHLRSETVTFDLASQALDVGLAVDVPNALLVRWSDDPGLTTGIELALRAKHDAHGPWRAEAEGALGLAPLSISATVAPDFRRINAVVRTKKIDPHAVHRSAPRGRIDLSITATMADQRVAFEASVAAASDHARMRGALLFEPALFFESVDASVHVASLRPYVPPDLPLQASVDLDLHASGSIDALKLHAEAAVHRLALGDLESDWIRVRADLDRGRGPIVVMSGEGAPVSSIDLQGELQLSEASLRLALDRGAFLLHGAPMSLAPSTVLREGNALTFEGRATTPLGGIELAIRIDPSAPLTAPGRIELNAPELSLAGVAALALSSPPLAGNVRMSLIGELGPKRQLRLKLGLSGASFRGSAPISGEAEFLLERALTGSLDLEVEEVAHLRSELASQVPPNPIAWTPADLEWVRTTIDRIDLAKAAEQAALQGVRTATVAGTASLSSVVRPRDDRLIVAARLETELARPAPSRAVLTATAAIPLDPSRWVTIDHRNLEAATIAIDPIDLAVLAPMAGIEPMTGRLVASASASAGLDRISLSLDIDGVRFEQIDRVLSAELRAEASARRTNVQAVLRDRPDAQRPLVVLEATLAAGVGDLLDGAPIAKSAAIDVSARLLEFPLEILSRLVDREDAFAGTLVGTATVGGTLSALRGHLAIEGDRPRLGSMDFDRFRIRGEYDPSRLELDVDLLQALGGSLRLRSKIGPAREGFDLSLFASGFSIAFINDVVPEEAALGMSGRLSADLRLSGRPEDPVGAGWLSLSDGTLLAPRPLETISGLAVELRASRRTITLTAQGRSGEGELSAELHSDRTSNGLVLAGKMITSDLPLAAGKMPIALDLTTEIDGAITADETRLDARILEGQVTVAEREAREVHEIEALDDVVFVDARGAKEREKKQARSPPKPSRTEISVRTEKPLPVRSRELNGALDVDLRLSSGRVSGRVVLGDGSLEIAGRSWRIERARVDLDGSVPPRPVLDVLLIHEFETVVVSILVTGTPDDPDVRFESNPGNYDQAALLAIVLGADPDQPGSDAPISNKAAGVATNYLVGAIRSGLGESLWLDTLSVEPGEQELAHPKIQLGKWITRELFLGYEHNFGATEIENQAEAILRYRFLPGWMIESRIGDRAQGLDLFWTKRF